MPIHYSIDQEHGLIRTRCVGEVPLSEVASHFATLVQDPDCPPGLDVLLDLSEMTSTPARSEFRAVSEIIAEVIPTLRFRRFAVVTSRPVIFGMVRVFEVFSRGSFLASRVFMDMDQAKQWLEESEKG